MVLNIGLASVMAGAALVSTTVATQASAAALQSDTTESADAADQAAEPAPPAKAAGSPTPSGDKASGDKATEKKGDKDKKKSDDKTQTSIAKDAEQTPETTAVVTAVDPVAPAPVVAPVQAPVAVAPVLAPAVAASPPSVASVTAPAIEPEAKPSTSVFAPPLPLPADARVDAPKKTGKSGVKGEEVDELPPGSIPQPGGLSISLGGQMMVGQSTFQVAGYARDPMVSWSGSLGLGYRLPGSVRMRVGTSLRQELTLGGGADTPQILLLGNTGVSVSRSLYNVEGGPRFFGSLSGTIPTSQGSRTATLITSLNAGVNATQPIGKLSVSLGTRFRKNFHRYTHPLRDSDAGSFTPELGGTAQATTGGVRAPKQSGELIDPATGLASLEGNAQIDADTLVNGAFNNTSMGWSNSLSLFYPVLEGLGLSVSYNLSHSWTYESYALDELSGVGAQEGRGRRDSHGGSFAAFYQLDQFSLRAGMSTGGSTRSSDDKRIRFPFFNFDGPESNRTTFFFGLTVTESIPL